uniref:Uncharacterized protein n=1 Tax=Phocoena sinus TaxID=42100 RepID=A0A8C9B279_PHOSS
MIVLRDRIDSPLGVNTVLTNFFKNLQRRSLGGGAAGDSGTAALEGQRGGRDTGAAPPLLLAAGCLAALCVTSAAQNTTNRVSCFDANAANTTCFWIKCKGKGYCSDNSTVRDCKVVNSTEFCPASTATPLQPTLQLKPQLCLPLLQLPPQLLHQVQIIPSLTPTSQPARKSTLMQPVSLEELSSYWVCRL